ncbi:MAG TPA: thiamine pyrophosphate-binding protein [Acidimicrobiia bacterium]|nr:thiamine pyrophosphate-binding protein [Acidimicrobiia bacterium]
MKIHGGQIIARALKAEGVDTVFTLSGGHIVAILDGCVQEGIKIVDVRHEQAAAHAAEAYTRLTGRLGVAVVTAGPGVTDSITGVATAWFARTPMLLIGGRHFIRQELRGGLQEMNHPQLFQGITAWAATAWEVGRLADYIATAARHAFGGRGAPVFLDVPMDVQFDMVDEDTVNWPSGYRSRGGQGADPAGLDLIVAAVKNSSRPLIFAGAGSRDGSGNRLREMAEVINAPTFLNSRARGSLPYDHPLLGNHARSQAMSACDLLIGLGVDWDFRTNYGERVNPDAVVVHVDLDSNKIGWNRSVDIGIVADPMTVVDQLLNRTDFHGGTDRSWADEIGDIERSRRQELEAEAESAPPAPVNPQRFGRDVGEFFGADAIVAVDGGDIVSTTARWLQVSHPGHVLDPGPFGTLGTGAPFALAAKVAFPEKLVGIVYGDGAFGFNGFEFDTFVRLGLPVIGVVGNDGVWGNIKTFHTMLYPDRVVAADLGRRPYHEVVRGLGGYAELVTDASDLRPALDRALKSGLPSLVNVHIAETMRMSSNYSQ